jgi:23S rRNA (uracil1939-C5)-methyltransferase
VRLELQFTALAYGGEALARLPDGTVVFVPFVLPGERALIELEERRRGYARGRLLRLLEPGAGRCAPRCRHFGTCGGCQLQHLDYPHQLETKRSVVAEQLRRLGSFSPAFSSAFVEQTIPSPAPWGYRNSLQLHWGSDCRPGFKERRSETVVAITECHLPQAPLAGLWPRLSAQLLRALRAPNPPGSGPGGRLTLRCGSDGPPLVIPDPPRDPPLTLGPQGTLIPAPALRYRVGPHSFRVSPASFFQVNTAATTALVEQVLRDIPGDAGTVVEAHSGVGLFSRFLAPRAARLLCVEISPFACADFRLNLGGVNNVELIEGRAEAALASLSGPCHTLVTDPPRSGLQKELIAALPRLGFRQIVYVSCDPATLARDARRLAAVGYNLLRVTPVDLFPQTYHVETVSVWRR